MLHGVNAIEFEFNSNIAIRQSDVEKAACNQRLVSCSQEHNHKLRLSDLKVGSLGSYCFADCRDVYLDADSSVLPRLCVERSFTFRQHPKLADCPCSGRLSSG